MKNNHKPDNSLFALEQGLFSDKISEQQSHQPTEKKKKKPKQRRQEARAFDFGEAIQLQYDGDAYPTATPAAVSFSASNSFASELEDESLPFEVEAFEVDKEVVPVSKQVTPKQETPVQPAIKQEVNPKPMEVKPVKATIVPASEQPKSDRPVKQITTVEPTSPKEKLSDAQEFAADLQAILNGEKTYDSQQKQVVSSSPPAQPPAAPTPHPHDIFDQGQAAIPPQKSAEPVQMSRSHAVFDQMGQNMAHATDFDQGTLDLALEQRFDEFDRLLDEDEDKNQSLGNVSGALEKQSPYGFQLALMTTEDLKKRAGESFFKKIFKSSAYAKIVDKVSEYEKLLKEKETNKNKLEQLAVLLGINHEISTWLDKHGNDTSKQNKKEALEELQIQIADEFKKLAQTPVVQNALPDKLVQFLLQGTDYAKSPTILFSYLMEKIVSIYKVGEITKENFKTELRNFLIADNDIIGSTSSAIQTSGRSGSVKVGFSPGRFIFPCFELGVEVSGGAKVIANRLIVIECQSKLEEQQNSNELEEQQNSNELEEQQKSLQRYSLMNMNGRTVEANLGVTVSIGVEVNTNPSDGIMENLEVDSWNCIPQETPSASAKAGASASVGGNVTGVFMRVSDPEPIHFNLVKEIENKLFNIVTSKNQSIRTTFDKEVFFSLFSRAYSSDAEIGAEASAEAALSGNTSAEAKVEVRAGVNASIKFSKYTYQTKLSNGVFKTQATTMVFKQVSTVAKAEVSAEAKLQKDTKKTGKTVEKTYDVLNSLYYESGFIYWDNKVETLNVHEQSGFSRGHSIIAENLIDNFFKGNTKKQTKYATSLAKALKVDAELMEKFLKNCQNDKLVPDILEVQENGHFIEATFAPSQSIPLELGKDKLPSADTFKTLSKPENMQLQSLRFRTALQDGKNADKTYFNLGLNLKVFNLGIDLGRVEDASSLKLTDYVVIWYDKDKKPTDTSPDKYVPTSFLFM